MFSKEGLNHRRNEKMSSQSEIASKIVVNRTAYLSRLLLQMTLSPTQLMKALLTLLAHFLTLFLISQ